MIRLPLLSLLTLLFSLGMVATTLGNPLEGLEEDLGLTAQQISEKRALSKAIKELESKKTALEENLKLLDKTMTESDRKDLRGEIGNSKNTLTQLMQRREALANRLAESFLAIAKSQAAQLLALKFDSKLNHAAMDLISDEIRLQVIERKFDQMIGGEYVREKLARLLSTPKSFCPAVQSCNGAPALRYEDAQKALNDTFFSENGKLGRQRGTGASERSPDLKTH